MCSIPKPDTSNSQAALLEQLNQQQNSGGVTMSNQKTATREEKQGNKRNVSSLRIPIKKQTNTDTTGINTADTTTGLNIPV